MPKSKRLMELMMAVNRKRQFKAQELADEFGVSRRTILRDLQELSELGVPLYSEAGPHGGYRIVRERVLPPIAFTEGEAVSMFFAANALRHYASLPFAAESASALAKFYHPMPRDVRDTIDGMKHRVDFVIPERRAEAPCLALLLEAAVRQRVLSIVYEAKDEANSRRLIQPAYIYASGGLWYCIAYCFLREGCRVFRCDRVREAAYDESGTEPVELGDMRTVRRHADAPENPVRLRAELSRAGVQRCEAERWLAPLLEVRPDGGGTLECDVPAAELAYLADFFIGLGDAAEVQGPPELRSLIRTRLEALLSRY